MLVTLIILKFEVLAYSLITNNTAMTLSSYYLSIKDAVEVAIANSIQMLKIR